MKENNLPTGLYWQGKGSEVEKNPFASRPLICI